MTVTGNPYSALCVKYPYMLRLRTNCKPFFLNYQVEAVGMNTKNGDSLFSRVVLVFWCLVN